MLHFYLSEGLKNSKKTDQQKYMQAQKSVGKKQHNFSVYIHSQTEKVILICLHINFSIVCMILIHRLYVLFDLQG